MLEHFHAIIWVGHHEARVFRFYAKDIGRIVIHPHDRTGHMPHKTNMAASDDAPVSSEFLERVAKSVCEAGAVIIAGPASVKSLLTAHIADRHRELASRISTVQTAVQPSDAELVALAHRYFRSNDWSRGTA